MHWKYAINTNSLKNRDIPSVIKLCQEVGADGIEWGLGSLETAGQAAREMTKMTRDAGLEIAGFLNAGQLWKTDVIRRWSEAVSGLGVRNLRVAHPWFGYNYDETLHQRESFPELMRRTREGLEQLIPLGKTYDLRYVLEMHSGSVVASAPCARQVMEGLDSRYVGIIYDPANTVLEGFLRPRAVVELLGEYLAYVHAKNLFFIQGNRWMEGAVRRMAWEDRLCPLDCGMVDYMEICFALKNGGYAGWFALEEFFADKPNPAADISQAIQFLKACEQAAPAKPQEPFTHFNE